MSDSVEPVQAGGIKLETPKLGEPFLLTPGPLTTSYNVKKAMLRDWGSWDDDFRAMTADMRRRLLAMAGDTKGELDCVPIQGSGTFAVEAMIGSFVPKGGKVLVFANGAYGKRAAKTVEYIGRELVFVDKGDYFPPRGDEVTAALAADPCSGHSLRNQLGYFKPDRRDFSSRLCRRSQTADRQHERVWGD
jgi:2-aminoethylphosphonate-pyruvate transaminase